MKHLDDLLAACAFGLCTIVLATFLGLTAGWAYGALDEYEQELITLASNPLLFGVVTAVAASRGSLESQQPVHLDALTVIGHRAERTHQRGQLAQGLSPATDALPGRS